MWWFLACFFSTASADGGGVVIRPGGEVVDVDDISKARPSTAPPITIHVQRADIHSVLRLFATFGINIVAADGVEGKVTAHMEAVPWDEALAAILAAEGLAARPFGARILLIEPLR